MKEKQLKGGAGNAILRTVAAHHQFGIIPFEWSLPNIKSSRHRNENAERTGCDSAPAILYSGFFQRHVNLTYREEEIQSVNATFK